MSEYLGDYEDDNWDDEEDQPPAAAPKLGLDYGLRFVSQLGAIVLALGIILMLCGLLYYTLT